MTGRRHWRSSRRAAHRGSARCLARRGTDSPSIMRLNATPVPTVTYTKSEHPRPAPSRASPTAAARTSDSTTTGRAELGGEVDATPVEGDGARDLTSRAHELADADADRDARPRRAFAADERVGQLEALGEHGGAAALGLRRHAHRLDDRAACRHRPSRRRSSIHRCRSRSRSSQLVLGEERRGHSQHGGRRSSRSSCGTRARCRPGGSTPRRVAARTRTCGRRTTARTCRTPESPKITSSPPRRCIELTPPGERLRLATVSCSVLDSRPIRASPAIR